MARVSVRHVSVIDLSFSVAHGLVFAGLIGGVPVALDIARMAREWQIAELLAVCVAPLIVWIFVKEDRTPVYQRAITLPVILIVLLGFGLFVRFLRTFWIYLLAKCVPLFTSRPSLADHHVGLLRSAVALPVFLTLAVLFLNKPLEPVFGLLEGSALDQEQGTLANLMLFGTIYFAVVGLATTLVRHFLAGAPARLPFP